MSGANDKARFYLEQGVPQLQELEQKKIFTKDEIKTLVKKRSDFEHRVLVRGSKAVDFARYAAWEMSLEQLRQKRCKRMRIKGSSSHAGQARVFGIFDRGVKKHAGDVALWMKAKATKKFKTVLTAAIRLHPTKPELWLYAAKWALELDADMNEARSYMQRGTRFCTRSKDLWIEYAKLEMIYLAKIAIRRRILGLDVDRTIEAPKEIEETPEESRFTTSQDMIAIPDFKDNTMQPSMMARVGVDSEAAKDPMTTPALNGAIPLAIFDVAKKQAFYSSVAAEGFFDMFAAFTQVKCLPKILQHVLDSMLESYPKDPATCNCYIRQPLIGIDHTSPEFAVAIGSALNRLKESLENTNDKTQLSLKTRAWIEAIIALPELDSGIQTDLQHTLRKLE
ncbi:hypothetical protein BOTNAR_0833g00020 [Botryotinia narcissicola]|uniref:U3 small nucleolar RNA-associated protein 6 N-terminal domain-containing protein n=1 Tax=Botryotinia narcissicola TaxID=278944 RepID=A0A4Z1H5D3_9HELO|nr:hypothetical protein BOTNAR_0833g00020 [Botryotinia narcissicola]